MIRDSSDTVVKSENMKVFDWRVQSLMEVGIREKEARTLASSHSDLHQMVDAKLAGCDVAVLCRIFKDY